MHVKKMHPFTVLMVVLMLFLLTSCSSEEKKEMIDDNGVLEPRYGGVLKLAYATNPSHFDLHIGTGGGYDMGGHMFERLFEPDASYVFQPDLAETYTVSEDGLVYTVKLHEGVLFHNGKELTAEDVVASTERWLDICITDLELAQVFHSVRAVDRYIVEYRLTQPHAEFKEMLAEPACVIMPREICEKYPQGPIPHDEIAGTGPYKLKEFVSDRYIHLVRFENYVPRGEDMDGRAGRKNAYLDEAFIEIIPDPSVRMMGVETGQYHYGWGVDFWEYERMLEHPDLYPLVSYPWGFMRLALNCSKPPMDDVRIRLAIQAAIDAEEILAAGLPPVLYELNCSKMWREVEDWYSEAGCQYYNQANPALARQLLEEAGYNGEPIVLLGLSEYVFLRDAAIVAERQLKNAGLNVEIRIADLGTFIAILLNPDAWHISATTASVYFTPTSYPWLRDEHRGWWMGETPRKRELAVQLRVETDHASRFAIWEELQELSYAEANEVWLGPYFSMSAASKKVAGVGHWPRERFWNAWLRE